MEAAQRQLADVQYGLLILQGGVDEYRRHFVIEKQRSGGFKALLFGFHSHLVNNSSIVNSVWDILCQDTERDVGVYLQTIFTAVCNRTAGFHFATASVVETHCATLVRMFRPS